MCYCRRTSNIPILASVTLLIQHVHNIQVRNFQLIQELKKAFSTSWSSILINDGLEIRAVALISLLETIKSCIFAQNCLPYVAQVRLESVGGGIDLLDFGIACFHFGDSVCFHCIKAVPFKHFLHSNTSKQYK